MSGKINVNYTEVYAETAQLKAMLEAELNHMENAYNNIRAMLSNVDGETRAALMEAIEKNREKARVAAMTLSKLLSFMSGSTEQIERTEQRIKNIFTQVLRISGGERI